MRDWKLTGANLHMTPGFGRVPAALLSGAILAAWMLGGAAARGQEPNDRIARLLADPAAGEPELEFLRARRRWLAGQPGEASLYVQVAEELAARGALFSAVEIAWFAEKITEEAERRDRLNRQMENWIAEAATIDRRVEVARQMAAAGDRDDAIAELESLLRASPYAEKAHHRLAELLLEDYFERTDRDEALIDRAQREALFRRVFERLQWTLAIDTIYYDAMVSLSRAREILRDDAEFLRRTEPMAFRALNFRAEVIPAMEAIEAGARAAEAFEALAEALEEADVPLYAIYACRVAIARGSEDAATKERLARLLERIGERDYLPADGSDLGGAGDRAYNGAANGQPPEGGAP